MHVDQGRQRRVGGAQVGDPHPSAHEAGGPRDGALVVEHDHGDTTASQAPGDAEPLVVAPHDQRPDRGARGDRAPRAAPGLERGGHRHSLTGRGEPARERARRPVTAPVSDSAPYQPPATKRMIGPKLYAAGAPRKCRPDTDDSIPTFSRG